MLKRISINIFVAGFLVLILIDGLPTTSLFHERLKAFIDPALDKTGLWQQSWQLFAPEVDRMNVRLSASFRYEDGTSSSWHSPDWKASSITQRFLRFREMEFIDAVRNDENRGAWPSLARYLAERYGRNQLDLPRQVILTRHWATVPPPTAGDRQPLPESFGMEGSYVILEHELVH